MGNFKSFSTELYNTVKPEYRLRIFYGNEDSAFDILMNICDSAIGLISETNLKFCFSVYVDTWTKVHINDVKLEQVKNMLLEKYHATSAKITDKTIDKSLEIIFNHEESLAKRFATVPVKSLMSAVCLNCCAMLPEGAIFCGRCGIRISPNNVLRFTPAPSISATMVKNTDRLLPEIDSNSSEKQIDRLTERISEQPNDIMENLPTQTEQVKTEDLTHTSTNPLPSPITGTTSVAKYENEAPEGEILPPANSSQKFPLHLITIVPCALVFITIGVILVLVLTHGSGNRVVVPETVSFMTNAEKYLLEMNYEQAIIEFNKVLEVDSMNVSAYLGKAKALIATGKTSEAVSLLEAAYIKTGSPDIFDELEAIRNGEFSFGNTEQDSIPISPVSDFEYEENDSGGISLTAYKGFDVDVGIPSTINGKTVTALGETIFSSNTAIQRVYIPATVGEINQYTFYGCNELSSIVVDPDSKLLSAQNGVLFNYDKTILIKYPPAKSDKEYIMPDSVVEVYGFAFDECKELSKITISPNTEIIAAYAFGFCVGLNEIFIPHKVTDIDDSAFNNCTNLENIVVDKNNLSYSDEDGVLFDKSRTLLHTYPQGRKNSQYTIPDTVNDIGSDAFFACSNLKSLTIPESVNHISSSSIKATSLQEIVIPGSVKILGSQSFEHSSKLQFVVIMNGTEIIGTNAFCGCDNLTSVTLPDTIESIGIAAFDDCDNITVYYKGNVYTQDNISLIYDDKKFQPYQY